LPEQGTLSAVGLKINPRKGAIRIFIAGHHTSLAPQILKSGIATGFLYTLRTRRLQCASGRSESEFCRKLQKWFALQMESRRSSHATCEDHFIHP
jgi:hypothetical protein